MDFPQQIRPKPDRLLGAASDIPPGHCKAFNIPAESGLLELFVVNHADQFLAYENRCPHTGVNLNWQPDQFLDIENRFIQCAVHGALFRIDDGICLRGPCLGQSLHALPLSIRDGRLWLEITSEKEG